MYKAKVYVTLRESILDPAGSAVEGSLHRLGFGEVKNVRMGKFITLNLDGVTSKDSAEKKLADMCEKLLANTVIEDYTFEIVSEKEEVVS